MSELVEKLPWNKKLEVLRVIKGWSQTQAAEKCNTNQKNFWNWETGDVYPRKNSRVAIANAFGVKEKELFS